jgi:hypothetical protein
MLVVVSLVSPADPFADRVVEIELGPLGGAGAPAAVLGPPVGGGVFVGGNDTLSLGLRGSILLEFVDNVVLDGPGPDLTVFENAFLVRGTTTLPPFAEPAFVSVSADGTTFRTFPCAIDVEPFFPGCAGVYPVLADDAAAALVPSTTPIEALVGQPLESFAPPSGSGGDAFDLAAVGLRAARFVRIQGGGGRWGLAGFGGFDLDAVAAVHSVERQADDDADRDGVPDTADGCPGIADPLQADGDGDGLGDACDPGGAASDGDADGVPDVIDACALTFDPGQRDGDADGVGDVCDRCMGVADPRAEQPCPAAEPDGDFDGVPDVFDPCPADPACGPFAVGAWLGGGRRREADTLLTWQGPEARRVVVSADEASLDMILGIAPDVEDGSVRVRVGRRDRTVDLGPFRAGSTRTVTVPLERRRTRVRVTARRVGGLGRRDRDRDRFLVIRKEMQ